MVGASACRLADRAGAGSRPAQWRRRRWATLMRRALPVVIMVGCALVGAWVGIDAVWAVERALRAAPAEQQFVVPAGTAEAAARGEARFRVPAVIPLREGGTIAVRNDDSTTQIVLGLPIAPGQTVRKRFAEPGRYRFEAGPGCSVGSGSWIVVQVGDTARSSPR